MVTKGEESKGYLKKRSEKAVQRTNGKNLIPGGMVGPRLVGGHHRGRREKQKLKKMKQMGKRGGRGLEQTM